MAQRVFVFKAAVVLCPLLWRDERHVGFLWRWHDVERIRRLALFFHRHVMAETDAQRLVCGKRHFGEAILAVF